MPTIEDSVVELCNDQDDDCDGTDDEDFADKGLDCDGGDDDKCADGEWVCDGFGLVCTDDAASAVEVCNGQDDDCDGFTDEELDTDADDDGHNAPGSCHQPADDCDDSSGDVYPGHPEQPYYCDGLDNDCDGQTDEGCDCSHS